MISNLLKCDGSKPLRLDVTVLLFDLLPALFVIATVAMLVCGTLISPYFLLPLALYFILVMVFAFISTGSLIISLKALPASVIQLGGYGIGFIYAFTKKIIFRQGRDVSEEVMMRKGK